MAPAPSGASRALRGAVAALLLLLAAAPRAAEAQTAGPYGARQTWTSRDKAYHFGVSAAGAGALYTLGRKAGLGRVPAAGVAAVVVGSLGVLREVDDVRRPGKYFSEKDLLWNGAGIALGIWIPARFLFRD